MIIFEVEKIYRGMSIEFLERQRRVCIAMKDEDTLKVIDQILKERENARV